MIASKMIQFFGECTTTRSPMKTTSSSTAPRRGRFASSPSTWIRCAGSSTEHPGHGRVLRLGARAQPHAGAAQPDTRSRTRAGRDKSDYKAALEAQPQGGRVVAVLRGRPASSPSADRVEPVARGAAAPLRGLLRRRSRHHGSGEPRREGGRRQDRSASTSGCRSSRRPTDTSPRSSTSTSTTSSCGSSGSRTWPRRW